MKVLLDFFFGGSPVTPDRLGKRGAGPWSDPFRPPAPPLSAGSVFNGAPVTKEDWARYERATSEGRKAL